MNPGLDFWSFRHDLKIPNSPKSSSCGVEQMVERVDSRERNPQNPRNPTKDQEMGKHSNQKPQTTRIQDPTKLLVGEGERGKQRSQDPQMGTSLASLFYFTHQLSIDPPFL